MENLTEHQEQVALVKWCDAHFFRHNNQVMLIGSFLVASQNGASLPYKKTAHGRYCPQANKLIAEGLKKGFPDLQLLIPYNGCHGLFVELKRAKKSLSKVSDLQRMWQERLNDMGYKSVICYGADEAIQAIKDYLGLQDE